MNDDIVKCPICGVVLANSGYDNHLAWRHPETNSEWIRPVIFQETKPEKVKILDESDSEID